MFFLNKYFVEVRRKSKHFEHFSAAQQIPRWPASSSADAVRRIFEWRASAFVPRQFFSKFTEFNCVFQCLALKFNEFQALFYDSNLKRILLFSRLPPAIVSSRRRRLFGRLRSARADQSHYRHRQRRRRRRSFFRFNFHFCEIFANSS